MWLPASPACTRGAPGATAAAGSNTAGSSAYSTSISSSAAAAISRVSAATAATSSRMQRTTGSSGPPLSARWSFTNPKRCCSTSAAVITATTPGRARARRASIETTRAWGSAARRMAPCAIPGTTRSWRNRVRPVALSAPSRLRVALPMTSKSAAVAAGSLTRSPSGPGGRRAARGAHPASLVRTSSVCSPSAGAGRTGWPGAPSSLIGEPIVSTGPSPACGTEATISRWGTCGSAITWSIALMARPGHPRRAAPRATPPRYAPERPPRAWGRARPCWPRDRRWMKSGDRARDRAGRGPGRSTGARPRSPTG